MDALVKAPSNSNKAHQSVASGTLQPIGPRIERDSIECKVATYCDAWAA